MLDLQIAVRIMNFTEWDEKLLIHCFSYLMLHNKPPPIQWFKTMTISLLPTSLQISQGFLVSWQVNWMWIVTDGLTYPSSTYQAGLGEPQLRSFISVPGCLSSFHKQDWASLHGSCGMLINWVSVNNKNILFVDLLIFMI